MSADLILAHIKSLLPPGSLYTLDEQGDLYKLFEAIAENYTDIHEFLGNLANIRDPLKTQFLEELENELGFLPDFDLTEDERRQQLAASEYNRTENGGTSGNLETLLRNAGFDVYVHDNDPAVDPALFPGDMVLNGPIFEMSPAYLAQCGGATTVCGNSSAVCGRFDTYNRNEFLFSLPIDPDTWPFVFFVGGLATRDGSGALTAIAPADVPLQRKDQLRRFILQSKPEETWAILIINYT